MGIQGLLPLLKSIHRNVHIKDFAGSTLGIDAYGWLHRGLFKCAADIAQGKPSRAYVEFAMNRVRMLQHFGVTPYVVFDGGHLPSKARTEVERAERRKKCRQDGLAFLQANKPWLAYPELQKSVDVTPSMAREFIEELKIAGVPYVVAPYEADSQLAYLEKQGLISGIISEDSDMLVFGVNNLITKLDQYGEAVLIRRAEFTSCTKVSFMNWGDKEFRTMAILAGCDYLASIDGLGLITAHRLIRKHKTVEQIVRNLQFDGSKKVPTGYLDSFRQAERTFLYQWVYCPTAKRLVNLNTLPTDLTLEDLPFIGEGCDAETAQGVASGALDPMSKQKLATPQRPKSWSRTKHVQQTPNGKPGKPISEFFKPVRTPLAELDPNSFTPSPSQRQLLAGQGYRSWPANQAPGSRRSSSTSALGPAISSRSANAALSKAQPKRPRLCASASTGHDAAATMSSHYFTKPESASPLVHKATNKRGATDNFELFSDDSTIEAMNASAAEVDEQLRASQVVGVQRSPGKKKKLNIFEDDAAPKAAPASQKTILKHSQDTTATASFSTTVESQTVSEAFGVASASSFASLTARWIHESNADPVAQLDSTKIAGDNPLPASSPQPPNRALSPSPLIVETNDECIPQSSPLPQEKQQPSIPLCTNTADIPLLASPASPRSRYQARFEPGSLDLIVASPSSRFQARFGEGLPLQGSEDLIVPQSPDSVTDDDRCRPKVDLSHFTFVV